MPASPPPPVMADSVGITICCVEMGTPLAQALQVSFQSEGSDDGTSCYRCELAPSWNATAVPQGGYALGVIVEACIQHQLAAGSDHVDPIHVSAHYLRATSAGTGQVRARLLKSGKTFTNLTAELVQQGTTKITAHLLFGDLTPSVPPGSERTLLAPPSAYARRLPLYAHPSTVSPDPNKPSWMKKMGTLLSVDSILTSRNDPSSPERTTSESVGKGGVVWGAWCELAHKDDKLTTSSIPYFCDTFVSMPELLPSSEPGSAKGQSWYPTITITVEFKTRIPSSDNHSARTVGLYFESRFQNDPEGRHNARVEVWTAPSEIGQGDVAKGWRDDQYCIAVADQMALMLPIELNIRQGTRDSTKL